MKKILYAILTIFMLCMMNGCSKEDGFYVYTVETTEFDQYAKETIGSYIYAKSRTIGFYKTRKRYSYIW